MNLRSHKGTLKAAKELQIPHRNIRYSTGNLGYGTGNLGYGTGLQIPHRNLRCREGTSDAAQEPRIRHSKIRYCTGTSDVAQEHRRIPYKNLGYSTGTL